MLYPYLTLNDSTEIVYSEMQKDRTVKVVVETPDNNHGFNSATCILPQREWSYSGYSPDDFALIKLIVENTSRHILRFAKAEACSR